MVFHGLTEFVRACRLKFVNNVSYILMHKRLWIADGKELRDKDGQPVLLPPEYGHQKITPHLVTNGCLILDTQATFHTPVKLVSTFETERQPLVIRVNLAASDVMKFPSLKDEYAQHAHSYNILMAPTAEAELSCLTDRHCSFIALVLTPEGLETLFDGHRMPTKIRNFVDRKDFSCLNLRSSYSLRRITREVKDCPYTGVMQTLYLHSRSLELVAEALNDIDESISGEEKLLNSERRRALEARDILTCELADPPTIETLARRVGMTPRRLNAVFRDVYGTSVFEQLADWRLDLGKQLVQDTDLSIKEIGFKLGYSYPNNFIHAFTRRFGVSPTTYRKK